MRSVDLSTLVDDISDALLLVERDWRIAYVNRGAERLLGRSRAALLDQDLWQAFPRLAGTPAEVHYRRAMVERQPETFDSFDELSGQWLRTRIHPVASGLAAYVLDVTERHEAGASMRSLYDAALIGLVWSRVDGHITGANDTFLRMVGYSRAELEAGQLTWAALTPPETRHLGDRGMRGLTAAGASFTFEQEYLRKDSERLPVLVAGAMLDPAGLHSVAFVLDLSERKRAESLIQRAQRQQAVATLAGGMAHEINNMMAAVIGFSHFVLEALPPTGALREDVEQIIRSARRAASVTQQVLAFTRQQVLNPTELDLNALVTELEPALAPMLGAAGTLELDLAPGLPPVRADRQQLESILVALVDNARAAITGGGRVWLRARVVTLDRAELTRRGSELRPGQYIAVAVEDNGRGMDAATLARVLEPFFTTRGVGQGRGLGLPSALGLMRQSGGDLWVDSALGVGTTVTLLFPVVLAPRAPNGAPATVDEGTGRATARAEGPLVLVVEDDAIVRVMVRRTLEHAGFRVLHAANGPGALRQMNEVRAGELALVVSDFVMPDMDGRALVDALRSTQPAVPVLFLSGYSVEEVAARAALGENERLMLKPFDPDTLVTAVRALLAARPS